MAFLEEGGGPKYAYFWGAAEQLHTIAYTRPLFTTNRPVRHSCTDRDFDAFFRTEVELSKAKRLYQQLETRLDQERAIAQDRQGSLHERILSLEAQLHKEK
jgi:hypothetical protein